jgi:hypothetical protein
MYKGLDAAYIEPIGMLLLLFMLLLLKIMILLLKITLRDEANLENQGNNL